MYYYNHRQAVEQNLAEKMSNCISYRKKNRNLTSGLIMINEEVSK